MSGRKGDEIAASDIDHDLKMRVKLGLVAIPAATAAVLPPLPRACPFIVDEFLADDFTYDRAVEQLYIRLTSWRPKAQKEQT